MPSLKVIVYTDALCTVEECESKVSGGKKPTLLSLDEVISIGKAHTRPPDAWSMGASHQSLSNQQCSRRTRALRRRPSRTRSACSCTPPARRAATRASTLLQQRLLRLRGKSELVGDPKGVMILQKQLLAQMAGLVHAMPEEARDPSVNPGALQT